MTLVCSYDCAGTWLWAKNAGSIGPDVGWSITPDSSGGLRIACEYIIYFSANDEINEPYTELARTAGTSYTHMFVAAEPRTFYRVSALKS